MFAWTAAEHELAASFAVILGTSVYKGSRLYQKLPNYRSRTQAMYALLELHPEFAPLREPIAKLSNLSKTRNDWVHGRFIKEFGGKEVRSIDLDEGLDSDKRSKPVKAADIKNHANAVRAWTLRLYEARCSVPVHKAWSEAQIAETRKRAGPLDIPSEGPPRPEDTQA